MRSHLMKSCFGVMVCLVTLLPSSARPAYCISTAEQIEKIATHYQAIADRFESSAFRLDAQAVVRQRPPSPLSGGPDDSDSNSTLVQARFPFSIVADLHGRFRIEGGAHSGKDHAIRKYAEWFDGDRQYLLHSQSGGAQFDYCRILCDGIPDRSQPLGSEILWFIANRSVGEDPSAIIEFCSLLELLRHHPIAKTRWMDLQGGQAFEIQWQTRRGPRTVDIRLQFEAGDEPRLRRRMVRRTLGNNRTDRIIECEYAEADLPNKWVFSLVETSTQNDRPPVIWGHDVLSDINVQWMETSSVEMFQPKLTSGMTIVDECGGASLVVESGWSMARVLILLGTLVLLAAAYFTICETRVTT
ncbi:hypothetical protein [Crateriforma conspicua]|uniref:Transmembrane protein n=1 Tax=Crateriforma conspicua TaxID=2527996 RepID=A0A5C5Y2D4_9PLAN|nr:hypothetical protein [Crateriforma conspicua]TWT69330.1 hypothetical protein Pan14r_16150 [Crateriforma conspicua]